MQGILYLSEDPNNNVIANCIPTLVKYISSSFQEYLRLVESIKSLVVFMYLYVEILVITVLRYFTLLFIQSKQKIHLKDVFTILR